jgi:hypothetical protein
MRFREDRPADLDRARREVAAWHDANPHGTADELIKAVGPGFHPHYAVVLRGVLFAVDRNRAHEITGTAAGIEAAPVLSALAGGSQQSDAAAGIHGSPSGRAGDDGGANTAPPSPGGGRRAS